MHETLGFNLSTTKSGAGSGIFSVFIEWVGAIHFEKPWIDVII